MQEPSSVGNGRSKLRAGDWVEVLTRNEILATLDKNGCLENLPFMPEMFAYCGRRFRVYKSAHKTCDTINGSKGRKMTDVVHLEGVRCNGQSHGGCEALCLIFWKTAWLRELNCGAADARLRCDIAEEKKEAGRCTETDVAAATQRRGDRELAYMCQATQLLEASEPLPWWRWSQYVEDYTSGNIGLAVMLKRFLYMAYQEGLVNLGIGIGPLLRWIYDGFQSLRGGVPYPSRAGDLPAGARTPMITLDLQPGEWVRVKSYKAIRATCDKENMNRGLKWDKEMVPYCGGTYQVLKRVTRILNEKTGRMEMMKTPCVILESVFCTARYSKCRLFCPRSIYSYWREIWLERTGQSPTIAEEAFVTQPSTDLSRTSSGFKSSRL